MIAARSCVAVTIPTARRPDGLARLLDHLVPQVAEQAGSDVHIVVVDNAPGAAIRQVVERFQGRSGARIGYVEEPEPGIPFARNACVRAAADSDALVFLDDDEWPAPGWLDSLLRTWRDTGADIVQGPATAVLPDGAPRWAHRSRLFDKDRGLATGTAIRTAYSYNTLVSQRVLAALGPSFDPAFRYTGSSDHHFFKQAADRGFRSVWSAEAVVFEQIGRERTRLGWVLKRGYRTGAGAAVSVRLRRGRWRCLPSRLLLIGANLGYGGLQLIATAHPRWSWVEGLRRRAIAAGLIAGDRLRHQEYRPSPPQG